MSNADLISGMAEEIWFDVKPSHRGHPPDAALKAARALASLYEDTNGMSLAKLRGSLELEMASYGIDDDRELGREMVRQALVGGGSGALKDVHVPHFEVRLERGELLWDGWSFHREHGRRNPADLHPNWSGSQVQSLLFDREVFSETRAREWAKRHGYKYGSVDTTERYHRLRQQEPDGRECRTISFGESGIKAVVCAARNPVGDEVDVTSGPGRGRRGVVEHETDRVARVRFAEGGRAHLERSALHTRGRPR